MIKVYSKASQNILLRKSGCQLNQVKKSNIIIKETSSTKEGDVVMKKVVFILVFAMLMLSACGIENENSKKSVNANSQIMKEENKETELSEKDESEQSPDVQAGEENKDEITDSNAGDESGSNEVKDKSSNQQQPNTQQSNAQQTQTQQSTPTQKPSTNQQTEEEKPQVDNNINVTQYWSYYEEVLRLVNQLRAEKGVAPLTLDTSLCKVAVARAKEMAQSGNLSHTRPNGEYFNTALIDYGISYSVCGENIAAGQDTPAKVVEDWKNSQDHYNNMVDPAYTKLGMGLSTADDKYGKYWCQLFKN